MFTGGGGRDTTALVLQKDGGGTALTERDTIAQVLLGEGDEALIDEDKTVLVQSEEENQVQCADGSLEFIPAGTLHSRPDQCEQSGGIIRCPPNVNSLCISDGRLVCNSSGCIEEAKTCPTVKEEEEAPNKKKEKSNDSWFGWASNWW